MGTVLLPYIGILTTPALLSHPAGPVAIICITLAAIVIFAWPVVGVHRLLEDEKRRLQDDNAHQLEAAIAETHRRMSAGQLGDMTELKHGMDNLVAEQAVLDKLPTWPWHPGTIKGLTVALLLPVFLLLIERFLDVLFQLVKF